MDWEMDWGCDGIGLDWIGLDLFRLAHRFGFGFGLIGGLFWQKVIFKL